MKNNSWMKFFRGRQRPWASLPERPALACGQHRHQDLGLNAGQTMLEYILVILVVITIAMIFYPRVKEWVLAPCNQNATSLACKIEKFYQRDNFRYWRIPGV